jgi:hypothetical protein
MRVGFLVTYSGSPFEEGMAELIEITAALGKVRDFNRLQRILLTCSGTLQGTLSAYFGREIKVTVTRQDIDPQDIIRRMAVLHDGKLVVCQAESELDIGNAEIRERVLARNMGIGQVLETLGVRPSFQLNEVGQTPELFWRVYTLRGPGVTYKIKETFPQLLYPYSEGAYGA